jgi:adenylate cyclase
MISSAQIFRGKILIVDDQEANVELLTRLLTASGYLEVSSTTDSSKVSELHLINHFDLILLDLNMPGMDGFQVMENLKQIETDSYIPVLVVTAQPEHKVRALKAGARDFVSKPFDITEVLARVHNMLEVRLLHREAKQLTASVLAERAVSERLVKQVPNVIAEHLKKPAPTTDPAVLPAAELVTQTSAEVMVFFSDVMEFTRFAEGANAQVLAGALDALSTRFDGFVDSGGSNRSTAVGDAYLAAMGLPNAVAARSLHATKLAFGLTEAMDRFNGHIRCKLKVRLDLGAAPAVVRTESFQLG